MQNSLLVRGLTEDSQVLTISFWSTGISHC